MNFPKTLDRATLPMLLAVSVIFNVALSKKAVSLHDQLAVKHQTPIIAVEKKKLPSIRGKALDGNDAEVSFRSAKNGTILYVFSPSCIWCKRNLANMLALERGTRGRYEFVGISLSTKDLQKYASDKGLQFQIIHSIPEDIQKACGFGGTPETLLVNPAGVVSAAWTGSYAAPVQAAVERQFGVKLPGMSN